ncbi:hypothetical protein V0U79_03075 [Hyphobacterium sp. HN65]|uniref:DUF202 domain-containing protein n=1 Tax=Hyphobacterium lacteum TaxID=3116575 RepID=A0ABU7LN60_9PROT|nr:hypothetical protein [Hyphobacterium sp. HN65]MEE2525334.1 hypothetical protein [Hyphobacterium sp. HN65]
MLQKWTLKYLSDSTPDATLTEDGQFWFRRFFTSLSIGNAAAILALGAYLNSSQDQALAASQIKLPFVVFSLGLALAAFTPLTLWIRFEAKKAPERLSFAKSTDDGSGEDKLPESVGYDHPIFWAISHFILVNAHYLIALISSACFVCGLAILNLGVSAL